jgi:hypothetical protein
MRVKSELPDVTTTFLIWQVPAPTEDAGQVGVLGQLQAARHGLGLGRRLTRDLGDFYLVSRRGLLMTAGTFSQVADSLETGMEVAGTSRPRLTSDLGEVE